MYYLPAWNRGLIQIYYCYVLFLPFGKSFKYYEKYFNSISIYSWKQISLLTNIRNKFVIRNINLWFFDVMKNSQIFPSKVCPFQYDHRFVFNREMGNIRMYILQNLLAETSDVCFENF